jgi:acyl-homoserine lactone acylase PvdQ
MRQRYQSSPAWLQALMNAWADGLNDYLYKHPDVSHVIQRYEPWMALTFSEGSIGGDIERISLTELEAFYGGNVAASIPVAQDRPLLEPLGSNGIAIAPANTASGHTLLWINPHTSFYFREEAHLVSEEGLNAYGALTWGQFFVYQGFNDRAGWMHTSSGVDNIDEFLETVVTHQERWLLLRVRRRAAPFAMKKSPSPIEPSGPASRDFTVYRSHHGPVVRTVDGKWVSVRLMDEPVKALMQSYLRTKATGLASFRDVMEMHTNSSNNTVFADANGNIAYFHANFIPRRDPRFDWTHPVDSAPSHRVAGVRTIDERPNAINQRSAGSTTPTTGPTRPPVSTVRGKRTFLPTWRRARKIRAACTPCACSTAGRISRSTTCATRLSTAICPHLLISSPRCCGPTIQRPHPIRSRPRSRADRGAADGTTDGRLHPCRRRSRSGATTAQRHRSRQRGRRSMSASPRPHRSNSSKRATVSGGSRTTSAWKTPWGDVSRFRA